MLRVLGLEGLESRVEGSRLELWAPVWALNPGVRILFLCQYCPPSVTIG